MGAGITTITVKEGRTDRETGAVQLSVVRNLKAELNSEGGYGGEKSRRARADFDLVLEKPRVYTALKGGKQVKFSMQLGGTDNRVPGSR